ncbi:hypothetical protein [Nocardioides pyridinolyticus]
MGVSRLHQLMTAVVVTASLTTLPDAARAAETCFGLTPTVVGSPDQEHVEGTDGDDVIVASDRTQVLALGGDDAICVRGAARVDAGDGDDRVRSHHRAGRNLVVLGSGSDRFVGSAGRDRVYGENFDGEDSYAGAGPRTLT